MDKNRFRNISFCAIGALLALALVQAWSLWRMYADRAEEFSRKVTLAMNRAAYDDLLIGNRRRTSQTRTSVVTTGNIDSVKLDMIDTISVKSLGAAGKVLSIRSKVDTLRTNIALRRGDKTRYIYQEVRMPSFTALQFNLSRYDSLLTRYLADAGIGLPYSVDVIRGRDGGDVAEIRLDSLAARTTGAEREEAVIASQKDAPQIRNPKVFTSRVTTDDKLLFRVKIENPHRELLRELFGIILTSVLMLLVVAFVVIYLLRTLFRQKTLEEMRMDFTHNITHELKTPIAVAYAANDALENFGAADDGARRAKYLGVIRSQLTALSEMVERILTMSREEREDFTLRRERILLAGMLGALAEKFRMQAAKPARVTVDVSPEGLTAFADRFHLSHALDNLVDNALKYSNPGGLVTVSAEAIAEQIQVRISDNGVGISAADLPKVKTKFFKANHTRRGSGIGLAVANEIITMHHGKLDIQSELGKGTTVIITLPAMSDHLL